MAPVRPDTTDEMVFQLWYAVIGSNGDGLASQVRAVKSKVEAIEDVLPTLMTRDSCKAAEKERDDKQDRRKISTREKAMLLATSLGSLAAIGAVVVAIVIR
jgi:Mg2+ and Co2+ transporter CorA